MEIADAVFGLSALFVPGAPPATCADACDINDDGLSDISDVIYLLSYLFVVGSPAVPAPHPDCGVDPSAGDSLDCAASSCP